MRGNTIKGRTLENPVPLMRERAKDWAVSQAGEDIIPVGIGMALFEIFQYGQPHRTDRIALFGFSKPTATSVEIDFIPPQTYDLAADTSRHRQHPNHFRSRRIGCVAPDIYAHHYKLSIFPSGQYKLTNMP